jgi:lipoate-protein ligase A
MTEWRLLGLEIHDSFTNMAIDEAILRSRLKNSAPNTLRFYRWNPSAVSIGRFQDPEKEVHLTNCRKYGVDVVRRITGGGTVYHDTEGEITYSLVVSKKDLGVADIAQVYSKIYAGLIEALKILGISADFDEGNLKTCPNLTVNNRKISGSAQGHKGGIVLQHGTLLSDVDLERMFTFLQVPWAKSCMEVVDIARNRITSVSVELGSKVSIQKVSDALVAGFQKAFGVRLAEGRLTAYECELAEKLKEEKYSTHRWNFQGASPTV